MLTPRAYQPPWMYLVDNGNASGRYGNIYIYIYCNYIYIYILYFNGKFFDDMRLQFVTLSHSGFAKLCLANALAQGDSN